MKLIIALTLLSFNTYAANLNDAVTFKQGHFAEIRLNSDSARGGKPSSKIEKVYFQFREPSTMVAEVFFSEDLTAREKIEVEAFYIELINEELKDMKVKGGKVNVEMNKIEIDASKL